MRVVDLFAGGGGMSMGFMQAGFDIKAAFDNWLPATHLYRANFKHPIFELDLSGSMAYREVEKWHPEVIIGGPPCQDFSSAGKRDEALGRADLTVAFAKIVSKVRPQYFVMENVERAQGSVALRKALRSFKRAGYGVTTRVLNASYCGVPQNRKRLFVVGALGGQDGFLNDIFDQRLDKKPMTLRDYFGDSLGLEHYYRHPRSYKRRGVFSIDEPSPTVRGVNRPVPKGYPGHPGDTAPVASNIRPMTTRERSWIQTYPRDFQLEGTKTDLEQIIGNAVPINLALFVARSLAQFSRKVSASR